MCNSKTHNGNYCAPRDELRRDDTDGIFLVGTPEDNVAAALTEEEYCWLKEAWEGEDQLEDGTHLSTNRPIECAGKVIMAKAGFSDCMWYARAVSYWGGSYTFTFAANLLSVTFQDMCIKAYGRG